MDILSSLPRVDSEEDRDLIFLVVIVLAGVGFLYLTRGRSALWGRS